MKFTEYLLETEKVTGPKTPVKETDEKKKQRLMRAKDLTKEEEVFLAQFSVLPPEWKFSGVTFDFTYHGRARAVQRAGHRDLDAWKVILRRMMYHIKDNKIRRGGFVFWSKSINQSTVIEVRDSGKTLQVVSVMPYSVTARLPKTAVAKGQELVLIERLMITDETHELLEECQNLGLEIEDIFIID